MSELEHGIELEEAPHGCGRRDATSDCTHLHAEPQEGRGQGQSVEASKHQHTRMNDPLDLVSDKSIVS